MPTPTPHISAAPGDFAPSILLPGDPLRAKHIADKFLDDVTRVNEVRNMLGFTGSYEGVPVSVMGTGMGIPSASIYTTELVNEYGVERLIRVAPEQYFWVHRRWKHQPRERKVGRAA